MFESLRFGWSRKQIAVAVILATLLALFLVVAVVDDLSSGQETSGIVLSTGPINVARARGGTREGASVQLSDGRIVSALVTSGGVLAPGAHVTLHERPRLWSGPAYEVIGYQ